MKRITDSIKFLLTRVILSMFVVANGAKYFFSLCHGCRGERLAECQELVRQLQFQV